jgi:hypothetical protein
MSDELVKRLRDEHLAMTRNEAADRIEALTAALDMTAKGWKEAIELTRQARLQYSEEKARAEKAEADNARLREVVLEADKLLCGDLAGLQWKRECRSFLVLARAVLKGETRD